MIRHIPMQKLFLKNNKGQVLPYFIVLTMILLISWAMMINIAKLVRDRMILQNSVDNTVLSVATLQARTLNVLGATNYLLATILSTASNPKVVMFPSLSTDKIAGSMIPGMFSDYKCLGKSNYSFTSRTGVQNLRKTVNAIEQIQNSIIAKYFTQYFQILKDIPAKDCSVIVVPSRFVTDLKNFKMPSFSTSAVLLGLKRNIKGITYYETKNYCMDLKSKHYHIVDSKQYAKDKYSWYVQTENFYDQKFIGYGIKLPSAKNNKGYPLFANLIGIKWPAVTAYAAAAVYNVDGAMFPDKESDKTGLDNVVAVGMLPIVAKQLKVFWDFTELVAKIPIAGIPAAAALVAGAAYYAYQTYNKIYDGLTDETTPVRLYKKSYNGGWDSHLVPIK